MYANTCDTSAGALDDISAHEGTTLSCVGEARCPGISGVETYTSSSPCEFAHKLCVTCEEDGGDVYIRIQTNSLPSHCFYAMLTDVTSSDVDFRVKFNTDVTGQLNYTDDDVNS